MLLSLFPFFFSFGGVFLQDGSTQHIHLTIDYDTLSRYEEYYFKKHPKASKKPIAKPYHESINQWFIMPRPMMNSLKQRWKDFVSWFVEEQGYSNLGIKRCKIFVRTFYETHRRHDVDNGCPKFILDGLVESGMIEDDDSKHITMLTLTCDVDTTNPRTELYITVCDEVQDVKKERKTKKHEALE